MSEVINWQDLEQMIELEKQMGINLLPDNLDGLELERERDRETNSTVSMDATELRSVESRHGRSL